MKLHFAAMPLAALLMAGTAATAQTSTETKVSSSTSMKDGVPTTKTKVVHTHKRTTRHPKRILGVKVGHKTVTHRTVKTTSTSANGNMSTSVKTN